MAKVPSKVSDGNLEIIRILVDKDKSLKLTCVANRQTQNCSFEEKTKFKMINW